MKFPNVFRSLDKEPEGVKGAVIRYNDENFVHKNNHGGALMELLAKYANYEPGKE